MANLAFVSPFQVDAAPATLEVVGTGNAFVYSNIQLTGDQERGPARRGLTSQGRGKTPPCT